jgi:lipid II:glycine glycyltransferase (peptidoglycan interpeptide bridge formation enzyme)
LDPGARRAISKARKNGVSVRPAARLEDLRAFFELHLRIRKYKYRLLAQPWRFFEAIWERFLEPGNGELLLAESDGGVIGGVLFLDWGDTTYYKFNASSVDNLALRPNDLVLWTGISRGAERGFAWLDFGVSDLDQDGLVRYKRKYATEEAEVITLRHEVPMDHRGRGARALLPALTDLFVDGSVPDAVSERAGNLLYRYFS